MAPAGGPERLIMVGSGRQKWLRGIWLARLHESDLQAPGRVTRVEVCMYLK